MTSEYGLNAERAAVQLSGWPLLSLSFQALGKPALYLLPHIGVDAVWRYHLF